MAATVGLNLFGRGFPTSDRRWLSFAEALEDCGYEIVDGLQGAGDFYVSVDFNSMPKWAKCLTTAKRILLAIEPPVVNPRQYTARVWKAFGTRIALSANHAHLINGDWHPSPSYLEQITPRQPIQGDSHSIGMINANKNSLITGNLYGLRREIIREMAKRRIDFVLAGPNWDCTLRYRTLRDARKLLTALRAKAGIDISSIDLKNIPTSAVHHMGPVQRKIEFFSSVQTVLVIENSRTYISEKLAEVISYSRVPIYVGPNLSDFDIPSGIAAQAEPNVESLMETFLGLSENQRTRILEVGQDWLLRRDSIYSKSEMEGMRSLAKFVSRRFAS